LEPHHNWRQTFQITRFENSTFDKNALYPLPNPIEDYRKSYMWRILCPYLINIKKVSKEEATIIIKDWLEKYDKLRKLEFNPQREVNIRLKNVKSFLPSSKETLKKEQPELYNLLVKCDVIQKH
jgi:hypothetical protein